MIGLVTTGNLVIAIRLVGGSRVDQVIPQATPEIGDGIVLLLLVTGVVHFVLEIVGGGLLTTNGREREDLLGGSSVQIGLTDQVLLAGKNMTERDEVSEHQPQEDVLAVQVDQSLEQ